MPLPHALRVSFREAYRADFGVAPDAERADADASAILEALGTALAIIAKHERFTAARREGRLDGSAYKRDDGCTKHAI